MEGLVADHNFITSHVSDVEMRRNSGCDFFFSLALSFSLVVAISLGRSRGNIGNYVSRPILNRCLTKSKSLPTRNFSLRILTYLDFFFFYRAAIFFLSKVKTFIVSKVFHNANIKGKIENMTGAFEKDFLCFISEMSYKI